MRFESFIALRYLRGKRKNRFVNLISIISVAGVCVGVMTLIVVMSVMTGFDRALRETIVGNRAHITMVPEGGRAMMDYETAIGEAMAASPEIVAAGPITQIEALLRRRGSQTGAIVLGVDPDRESKVTMLAENLTTEGGRTFGHGKLPGDKEIVLGYRLARRIGVDVGSEISVLTSRSAQSFLGRSRGSELYLTVSGIAQAKMSDFDALYAFVNIETARMLSGEKGVDGIHMVLNDAMRADAVKAAIESELPYYAETWYENQQAFFGALEQEKFMMFVILSFVVLVAAFNITSTLIMVVMEKRRDIGILRTLGVSTRSILTIFILEGLMIGLGGTFFGVTLGTLFATNLNGIAEFIAPLFGFNLFDSEIYYFDRIPVEVVPFDVAVITVTAVLMTFLSTLYPAWSASRLSPVDALRYE